MHRFLRFRLRGVVAIIATVVVILLLVVLRLVSMKPHLVGRYIVKGSEGIEDLALSADDRTAYVATYAGGLCALDLDTGKVSWLDQFSNKQFRVAMPKTNDALVVGDKHGWLKWFDLKSGTTQYEVRAHDYWVRTLAVLDDKTVISGALGDSEVCIWHVDTNTTHKLKGHSDSVFALAVSPNQKMFASGGSDETIIVWDLAAKNERARLIGHRTLLTGLQFVNNDTLLSVGFDETLKVWNLASFSVTRNVHCRKHGIHRIAFSEVVSLVAIGDSDGFIQIWSWPTFELRWTVRAFEVADVTQLQFSANGRKLIASSGGVTWNDQLSDGEVTVWQLP